MCNNNKISVIIPCFNCDKTIFSTIESLYKQSLWPYEIICIDDGSSDNTLNKLNEIVLLFKELNIIIISKTNGGVSSARNLGIEKCTGEFVIFIDADDRVNPTFIEKLYNSMCHGADTAFCKAKRIRRDSCDKVDRENIKECEYIELSRSQAMDMLMYRMDVIQFCCFCYKREILDRNCIRFNENTKRFEDREFNWKYLANCKKICYYDQYLYDYIINAGSAVSKLEKLNTDGFDACKRIEKYIFEKSPDYYVKLTGYLFHRLIWSKAKSCAVHRRKDLFYELMNTYDVKKSMKIMRNNNNILVSISAHIYLINPHLFYYIVGLRG